MKFRKLLSLLIAAVMVLSLIPATVFAEGDAQYYVAGSQPFFEWGWTTGDERALMTFDGEKYVAAFNSDGAYTNVNFKIVECTEQGQNWYGDTDGGNVIFCTTGEGDIVISYDPVSGFIGVSGSAYAPASFAYESVYAVGDGKGSALLNGAVWSPDSAQNLMTEYATDKWTIVYKNVEPTGCFEVKFTVDGSWDVNFGGSFATFGQDTAAVLNGGNIYFELSAKSDVTLTLDLSQFDISTKQGASFRVDAEPVPETSNIVSVEVPEFHITQFLDGDRDTGWRENDYGEWEEYDCYWYNVLPPYMKVTFENGDVFEGSYNDFINGNTYGWGVAFNDRQDTGRTYDEPGRYESSTLYFYHEELTPDYEDQIIVDYAFYLDGVESISVDNVTKTAYTNGNYTMGGTFDQEGNYTAAPAPWFYHDLYSTMQVTFCGEGGRVLKQCTPNELYTEKGVQGEIRPSQQYGAEFGVGTRDLVYSVYGLSCDFELTLTEPEYRLVAVAPVSVPENSHGEAIPYGYYDNEEYKEDEYYKYDLTPRTVTVERVATGERFDVPFDEAKDYIGHDPYVTEGGQTAENRFTAGNTYTVSLWASGNRIDYPFEITERGAYELGRVTIKEYTHGNRVTTHVGGDPTEYRWYYYNVVPEAVRIVYANGTVETVDFEEFREDHDVYVYDDGQNYDSPWGVGVHKVNYRIDGVDCEFEVEIVPNGIESISVSPTEYRTYEGANCNTLDNGQGGTYNYYYLPEVTVTIHFTDGHEESYKYWDLYNTGYFYEYSSDQGPNNEWGTGSHTFVINVAGKSANLTYIIEENPISSVTVDDFEIIEGTHLTENYWIDAHGEEHMYYSYPVYPRTVRVEFSDGTSFVGSPDQLKQQTGVMIDSVISGQSEDKVWGLGEHEVTARIGGYEVTYTVTIVEDSLESISIYPATYSVIAGTGGYISSYDGQSYFYYNFPSVEVTLHFKDGSTETYDYLWQLREAGYDYSIESNQSPEEPWDIGDHFFTLRVNGKTAGLTFTVEPNPVESIKVDDLTIIEGERCWLESWDDPDGTHHEYERYNVEPDQIKVNLNDGTSFEGTPWEVSEHFGGVQFYTSDEQDEDVKWGVGEHTACFIAFGFRVAYTVTITESPVASIHCDDVSVTEGTHGGYTESEYGDYYRYNTEQTMITVNYKDGTSLTCSCYELYRLTGYSAHVTDDQSYENQWGVGDHKATLSYLGAEYEFTFTVTESPVDRIECDPIVLEEGVDGYRVDDTAYGGKAYFRYVYFPEFTVYLKDGTSIRSDRGGVEILGDYYTVRYWDDQHEEEWTVGGDNEITMEVFGFECVVHAQIVPASTVRVEIADGGDVLIVRKINNNGEAEEYKVYSLQYNLANYSAGIYYAVAESDKGDFAITLHFGVADNGIREFGDDVYVSLGELDSNVLDKCVATRLFMFVDMPYTALFYLNTDPSFDGFDGDDFDLDAAIYFSVMYVCKIDADEYSYSNGSYIFKIRTEKARAAVAYVFGVDCDVTQSSYYDTTTGRLVFSINYDADYEDDRTETLRDGDGYKTVLHYSTEGEEKRIIVYYDQNGFITAVEMTGEEPEDKIASITISGDETLHIAVTFESGATGEADVFGFAPKFFGPGYFDAILFTDQGTVEARINYFMDELGVARFGEQVSISIDGVTSNTLEFCRAVKLDHVRGILAFTLIAIKDHEPDFAGFNIGGEYDPYEIAALAVKNCVDYYHAGTVVEGEEYDTVTVSLATVRDAVEYTFGIDDFTMKTDADGNCTFRLYHSEMYYEDTSIERTPTGWTLTCEPKDDYGFTKMTVTFDYNVNALAAVFEGDEQAEPGDVNGDGELTMKDVLLMRRYIAGLDELTDAQIAAGDFDDDGDITMKDVLRARRIIAGLD